MKVVDGHYSQEKNVLGLVGPTASLKAGWAPEALWTCWEIEKLCASLESNSVQPVLRHVSSHYTN